MHDIVSVDVLFEVVDIFGKKIRTTPKYWRKIKEEKHADLEYGPNDVIEVLENPDEVRRSVTDSTIVLYYKQFKLEHTLIVAAKHFNGDGFVVTVYQTAKSKKKGEKLWPKT